jgi:hypothetical protein
MIWIIIFKLKKGLGPLSPILFNFVADVLVILISREKEDGQVEGIIPHFRRWGSFDS